MCLNPLPSPPSQRCDDVMTNTRQVFVNRNVIKTHFVDTYQRKGSAVFYLFLVMMTVTLFSRVSIVSRAQKFL